jgi:hypothetical protein
VTAPVFQLEVADRVVVTHGGVRAVPHDRHASGRAMPGAA